MTTEPNNEPAQELSEKELEDISAGGKTETILPFLHQSIGISAQGIIPAISGKAQK